MPGDYGREALKESGEKGLSVTGVNRLAVFVGGGPSTVRNLGVLGVLGVIRIGVVNWVVNWAVTDGSSIGVSVRASVRRVFVQPAAATARRRAEA